jgi:hypothetical protein
MMDSRLQFAAADARLADMRRAAEATRQGRPAKRPASTDLAGSPVTLRFCSSADQRALADLAALDSATTPTEPVLLAEVDGRVRAALSLADGVVVADPFYPTVVLIELLHARSRQLHGFGASRRRHRLRPWRRAVVQNVHV